MIRPMIFHRPLAGIIPAAVDARKSLVIPQVVIEVYDIVSYLLTLLLDGFSQVTREIVFQLYKLLAIHLAGVKMIDVVFDSGREFFFRKGGFIVDLRFCPA